MTTPRVEAPVVRVEHVLPAPVLELVVPAAPALVPGDITPGSCGNCIAPAPAVSYAAPAPVIEYVAPRRDTRAGVRSQEEVALHCARCYRADVHNGMFREGEALHVS